MSSEKCVNIIQQKKNLPIFYLYSKSCLDFKLEIVINNSRIHNNEIQKIKFS